MPDIWAVVPVKEFAHAKQRLAARYTPAQRQALAAAMVERVLAALAAAPGLGGIVVVSVEPLVAALAERVGARVVHDGARDGHTGAVAAAARLLTQEGRDGMLTLPGDVPAITSGEVTTLLAAHGPAPAFTIVPAHDGRGSNAILCSPPEAVPLRFGDDSFLPHLDAARAMGIAPIVVRVDGIGMDIDRPEDVDLAIALGLMPAGGGLDVVRLINPCSDEI